MRFHIINDELVYWNKDKTTRINYGNVTFGQAVKIMRSVLSMSKSALCARCEHISIGKLNDIEADRLQFPPSGEILEDLAWYLRIDIVELRDMAARIGAVEITHYPNDEYYKKAHPIRTFLEEIVLVHGDIWQDSNPML